MADETKSQYLNFAFSTGGLPPITLAEAMEAFGTASNPVLAVANAEIQPRHAVARKMGDGMRQWDIVALDSPNRAADAYAVVCDISLADGDMVIDELMQFRTKKEASNFTKAINR